MIKILIFFIFVATFFSETLVFSTVELSEKSSSTQIIAKKILEVAYKDLGYDFIIKPISGERAIWGANNGEYDGELYRVKDIEVLYKNLIRVKVPLTKLEFVVYSLKEKNYISSFEDLRGYKIAYPMGIKILEMNLMSFDNVYATPSYEKLFLLLKAERVDYIILDRINGDKVLDNLNFKNIIENSRVLLSIELFHYLNKKHRNISVLLEEKLLQMKITGEIEKINNEILIDY